LLIERRGWLFGDIEGDDEVARDGAGHDQRYQPDDCADAEQHAYDHDVF
jgi:hypothetical protein